MERLQKIIASSGYCSRRKAEELIKKGNLKEADLKVYLYADLKVSFPFYFVRELNVLSWRQETLSR